MIFFSLPSFPLICPVAKGAFNTCTPLATLHLGLLSPPMFSSSSLSPRRSACRSRVVRWFEFCVGGMGCAAERAWLTALCSACVGFNRWLLFHVCNLIFSFCCLFLQPVVPPADVTTGTFTHPIRRSLPRTQTQTHSSAWASDNGRRDLRNVCFSFTLWRADKKKKERRKKENWLHGSIVDDTALRQRGWS